MEDRRKAPNEEHQQMIQRLSVMEDKYEKVSVSVARLEVMVDNFISLVERFESILNKTNDTLNGLNITIVRINSRTEENTIRIDKHGKEIEKVTEKLNSIDDKGKVDLIQLFKDNFLKFVFGGGILTLITLFVDKIVDSYMKVTGK